MNPAEPEAQERVNCANRQKQRWAPSFRDPDGSVSCQDGRIFRAVRAHAAERLRACLASPTVRGFVESGRVVHTWTVPEGTVVGEPEAAFLVEHERIDPPTYPYEWPPEMLHAAGVLTLELASQLLEEGLGLKDATPYNVLFRGPEPVFIDVLSIERRDPADPVWLPYGQFVRTFLLPLLAYRRFNLAPAHIFATRRDGIEPEEFYHWLSPWQRVLPPFLTLVSIPTWLSRRNGGAEAGLRRRSPRLGNPEKAGFILRSLLRGLRAKLDALAPGSGRQSVWADYTRECRHYSGEDLAAKEAFVREALREQTPRRVLDVGCNTGNFSVMAASLGAEVLAIDADPVVVGELWRKARTHGMPILPLVVDLTRPSPAMGWGNREQPSFLDRAKGAFDAVLMLAVLHHMLVSERIPLEHVCRLAAELTTGRLIIEFVGPEDPMFKLIARGRDVLHSDLSEAAFETVCSRYFHIVRSQRLSHLPRRLYLLAKRSAA